MNIPAHIGIIMDGNGRWAKERSLPRTAGHKKGASILQDVLTYARKRGVKIVTLYAFSCENWNRPKEEVDTLMDLFRSYLKNDVNKLIKDNIRVSFIGDKNRFASDIKEQMIQIEEKTKNMNDFRVVLALNYGARDDITRAVQQIAKKAQNQELDPADITPKLIKQHLATADIMDPDLIIRTSNEHRVSNFLLWELAYAEFYFTPVHWPDFNEAELDKALENYALRERRFGKTSEQIKQK